MGLAASQCRILYLTNRQNDIQYEMMCIAEQQSRLTTKTSEISLEYSRAISDKNIQIQIPNSEAATGYKYENITYANLKHAGYYLLDANVDAIYLMVTTDDSGNKNWDVPKGSDEKAISPVYTVSGNEITYTDDEGTHSISNTDNLDNGDYIKIGDKYYLMKDAQKFIENYKLINNKIIEGTVNLSTIDSTSVTRYPTYTALEDMSVEYDTSNDEEAYAKYIADLQKINAKDSELDTQLKLLETEQTAITKELESVGQVIKDNVDKSYGIFAKS